MAAREGLSISRQGPESGYSSALEWQGSGKPWDADITRLLEYLRTCVPAEAVAVALFHGRTPQLDEMLLFAGFTEDAAARWASVLPDQLPLFRSAVRHGMAMSLSGQDSGDPGLSGFGHVMAHMLPQSLSEPRWWCFVLANRERPFSKQEQQLAGLLLRSWQTAFDQQFEPIVGRMLLGHDHRLIHADPWTLATMLNHPDMLEKLLGAFEPVIRQRWPQLPQGTLRDLAVELAGRPFWVRFHRSRALPIPTAEHWYLELHPLEAGELPTVGVVDDPRIAQAIGFIHENYQRSPSLAEMAAAVHVSPFHFHRVFSRSVGMSPKHYLQAKQLQVARWLLRASRTPVGAIAGQTGFSSHGHFTSTFHRIVGVSPSDYRENH